MGQQFGHGNGRFDQGLLCGHPVGVMVAGL